jgi:4-hydroxythreonine-4-phosphate dehydrogenase
LRIPPKVLTMGEPAGIGAEITLKAWQALRETRHSFFLLHDPVVVADSAQAVGLDVPITIITQPSEATAIFARALPILPMRLPGPVVPGMLDVRTGLVVIDAIRRAVAFATSGEASAVVTNPIQKSALYAAGFRFPGHTEFLEHLAGGSARATMMLAAEDLRVVPVSNHQSLMSAITGLSAEKIIATARATAAGLRQDFGIFEPRLAVAGLNPHAGENGSMGREEIEIITPAVEALRSEGVDARGPLPPDTMFTVRARREYDAAICMYHD